MGVGSERSKIAALALRVFDRPVHPEWFTVRAHRRVSRRDWEADVQIVDGGHAIVWGSGLARASEVLIASDVPLPESGQMFESAVRRERSTRLEPGVCVEYQTCFAAERLDPEVFAHLTEELALNPERNDLVHRNGQSVSLLHLELRGRGLSVQAFHTFPGELAIVRVQSLFEVVG